MMPSYTCLPVVLAVSFNAKEPEGWLSRLACMIGRPAVVAFIAVSSFTEGRVPAQHKAGRSRVRIFEAFATVAHLQVMCQVFHK